MHVTFADRFRLQVGRSNQNIFTSLHTFLHSLGRKQTFTSVPFAPPGIPYNRSARLNRAGLLLPQRIPHEPVDTLLRSHDLQRAIYAPDHQISPK